MPSKGSVARYHELNDQISVSELSAPIYAGAIVLVLSGMLQTLKYEIDATYDDWEKSAPLMEGCSVGAIIVASGNNFRHNDEWARTRRPTRKQLPSIRVLAAAFKEPIAADGSGHKFGRNICPATLELLSGGSFDGLASNFFAFARNMVERRLTRGADSP